MVLRHATCVDVGAPARLDGRAFGLMADRQCLCVLGMVWRFGYGHSWRLYPISMVGKMGQCWWGSVLGATMTGPVLSDVGLSV